MIELRACESLARQINTVLKNFPLYPKGHSNVVQPMRKSYEILRAFFNYENEITITLHDDVLWIQEIPLHQEAAWDLFKKLLLSAGKDAITIKRPLGLEEWESFMSFFAGKESDQSAGDPRFENIVFRNLEKGQTDAQKVYDEAKEVLRHVQAEVRMGRIPKADIVFEVVDKIVGQILKSKEAMIAMTLIKNYDEYLFAHSLNVTILCLALGETLNLGPDLLKEMGVAAMLHDVGKTNIDPAIVLKPDKLTESEWVEMKKHPEKGRDIIDKMEGLPGITRKVALEHHMRYNHSGYPAVQEEYKIHPASLMLSICDTYDAMTSQRIYQTSRDPREALTQMMKLAGVDFEPSYLKAFVKMLGLYPHGMLVKLSTGETAIVSRPNPSVPDEPVVKVIYDLFGNKCEEVKALDLSVYPVDKETGSPVVIVGTVNPSWGDIDITEYIKED